MLWASFPTAQQPIGGHLHLPVQASLPFAQRQCLLGQDSHKGLPPCRFLVENSLGWIPSSPAAAPGTTVLRVQHAHHAVLVAQTALPCRDPSLQPSWADRISRLLESVLGSPGPVNLNLGDELLPEGLARAAGDAGVQVGTAVGTACHDRVVIAFGCVGTSHRAAAVLLSQTVALVTSSTSSRDVSLQGLFSGLLTSTRRAVGEQGSPEMAAARSIRDPCLHSLQRRHLPCTTSELCAAPCLRCSGGTQRSQGVQTLLSPAWSEDASLLLLPQQAFYSNQRLSALLPAADRVQPLCYQPHSTCH